MQVLFRERENNLSELAKRHKEYENKLHTAETKLQESKKTIATLSKRIKSLENTEHKSKQKIQNLQEELKKEKKRSMQLETKRQSSIVQQKDYDSAASSISQQISAIIGKLPAEIQANVPRLLKSTIETFYPNINVAVEDMGVDTRKKAIALQRKLIQQQNLASIPAGGGGGAGGIDITEEDGNIKRKDHPGVTQMINAYKPPSKRRVFQQHDTITATKHVDNKKQCKTMQLMDIAHATFDAISAAVDASDIQGDTNGKPSTDIIARVESTQRSIDVSLNGLVLAIEAERCDADRSAPAVTEIVATAFLSAVLNCAAPHAQSHFQGGKVMDQSSTENGGSKVAKMSHDASCRSWFFSAQQAERFQDQGFLTIWCSKDKSNHLPWLVYALRGLDDKMAACELNQHSTESKKRKAAEPWISLGQFVVDCARAVARAALGGLLCNVSQQRGGARTASRRCTATGACACAAAASVLWRTLGDVKSCHAFLIDCVVATMHREELMLPLIASVLDVWPDVCPQKGGFALNFSVVLQYACSRAGRSRGDEGVERSDGERLLLEGKASSMLINLGRSLWKWNGCQAEKGVGEARQFFSKFFNE